MTGTDLVDDDDFIDEFSQMELFECANRCAKSDGCVSVNYCAQSAAKDSVCQLASRRTSDAGVKLRTDTMCRNYGKTYEAPKLQKSLPAARVVETGMTS